MISEAGRGTASPALGARRARPRVREFLGDSVTPLALYRRAAEMGAGSADRFLFESVTGGETVSRYSFLGGRPSVRLRLFLDRVEIERQGRREVLAGDPLATLRRTLTEVRAERDPALPPFAGGWVGYFGFDLIRLLERLPARPPDPYGMPVAVLARYDCVVAFDHARQRVVVVSNEVDGEVDGPAAEARLEDWRGLLARGSAGGSGEMPRRSPSRDRPAEPVGLAGDRFRAAVEQAREHIAAGDIFQVVLARRWSAPATSDALSLYRALRLVNPSPYMFLLEMGEGSLVGASPEMLLRVENGRLATRPIAGTRRRGGNAEEDAALAAELLADEKERSEHVMLVDLGRNDIGRVAAAGSVRVTEFLQVERYSHVMHLVSGVEGRLRPGCDALDALLASFPAGTVSGAPKVRALEIIDQLEPEGRGPYAGAVGYLSFTGDLDTCITIRTLVLRGGEVSVTAGAGIVADSNPAAEDAETRNKAAALLEAVDLAAKLSSPGPDGPSGDAGSDGSGGAP